MSAGGVSRRDFLTRPFRPRELALAASSGAAWSWAVQEAGGTPLTLRPPGARDEQEFRSTCIRCGQCVEACPYDTLELAHVEDDPDLGTPHFEPRQTPCYMCPDTPCVAACPTDSLVKETAIEDARMGLAVLSDTENCLAFLGLRCEVCYRDCPLIGRAMTLEFRPQERTGKHAFFIPVVNSDHCTGCGVCEHKCVLAEPAIRVLPAPLVKGKISEGYRIGWREAPRISPDFQAPDSPPQVREWEGSLERALEQLNAPGSDKP